MDKYYVRCGELDAVYHAHDPESAARNIHKHISGGEVLSTVIYVDPRGFRGPRFQEEYEGLKPKYSWYYHKLFPEDKWELDL